MQCLVLLTFSMTHKSLGRFGLPIHSMPRRAVLAAVPLVVGCPGSASADSTWDALKADEELERLEAMEERELKQAERQLKKAEEMEARDLQRLLKARKNPFGRVANPINRDRLARKADSDEDNLVSFKSADAYVQEEYEAGLLALRVQREKIQSEKSQLEAR